MNLGKIRNRGIELLLTVVPVRTNDFEWSINWNYTKNNNKVLKLPEEMNGRASIYGFSGGTGLYAIEGKELGIFEAYAAKKTDDGRIIVDANGLPQNTDEQVEIGSINYKYMMGIGNTLRYKGVSLSFDFDIRHGGLMFSRTKDIEYFTGNAMQTAYNDRNPWIIPNSVIDNGDGTYSENDIALNAKNIYNYWNNGELDMGAFSLIDKSYVKLRQVVLGWDLPSKWLAKTFLTGVRVSVFGNNLLLWTPSSNTFVDPESSSFGNDLTGNFGEYSANPSSRKFGFNVNIKF